MPTPILTLFDELACPHISCSPRDSSFVPLRASPESFSAPFSGVDGGRFSWVFKSTLANQEVALKVLKKTENSDFQKELDILKHLGHHPNVIGLFAVCDKIDGAGIVNVPCLDRGIVLPWHSGGSLQDFIKRYPQIISDDKGLRILLLGICRGVEALHKQKVVHRDIACRNFLVSADGRIVLSDFGLSRRLEMSSASVDEPERNYQYLYYDGGGVLPFRSVAPESLSSLKFTMRSDIWSLGVLAIDLATKCRSTPFGNIRSPVDLGVSFATNPNLPTDQLPNECPLILRYFVETCCNMAPERRPPIKKLVEVAWIPNQTLRTMVSTAALPSPPEDESKEAPVQNDVVDCEYSRASSSWASDLPGGTEQVSAQPDDAQAPGSRQRESVKLSMHEVLHLGKVLREHNFDDSLVTLLTDEDMGELHSRLDNAFALKVYIRKLQEKHEKPRASIAPVRWWRKLRKKKPKKRSPAAQLEKFLEQQIDDADVDPCKVLLLGATRTGKSTLFKYLIENYGKPMSVHDRFIYRHLICNGTIQWMQALVAKSTEPEFLRQNPECAMKESCLQASEVINSMKEDDRLDSNIADLIHVCTASELMGSRKRDDMLDSNVAEAISELWADDGIKTCFEKLHNLSIGDADLYSVSHFFNKVHILANNTYVPSDRDCLLLPIRTSGLVVLPIVFEGLKLQLVDLSGARSERRKWGYMFPHSKTAIFCAALSEYNEDLYEDASVNAMAESLQLFEKVVNSKWGCDVSFTLILTKEEPFKSKIGRVPLTVCFPDYQGPSEYESALTFIKQQFMQRVHDKEKVVRMHVTDLLDSSQVDTTVWTMLKGIAASHDHDSGSEDFSAAS